MQGHCDWRLIVFEEDPLPDGFATKRESRGFKDADPKGRNIDHEFGRIPQQMRQIYLDLIEQLRVRLALQNEIDRFLEQNWRDDLVAVHMRTWLTDHWDTAPIRHQHYFNFAYYEELVDMHPGVFISSDNASYLEQLKKRFGDKIISYESNNYYDHSQVAFINLNLLAQGTKLIGSSLSTFTEMAWWLGGCQAEITLGRGTVYPHVA